jgi:hypothetical protein
MVYTKCTYVAFIYIYIYLSTFGLRDGSPRDRSSSPGRGKKFLFSMSPRPVLGRTQPPIQWIPGSRSPRVKWPGREADQSPKTSSEVKKTLIYTFTPPYDFMV